MRTGCLRFVQVKSSLFIYIMSSTTDGQSAVLVMQTPYSAKPVTLSIAAVERDTGLSKDTLRVWERRYGFPMPERDTLGERSYPFTQVERLRTIKRLLDAGHRPGRVVPMAPEDVERLAFTVGLPAAPREATASAAAPTATRRGAG